MARHYEVDADESSSFVHENRNERSNLPQEVIMKTVANVAKNMPIGTPYGISAIDEQIGADSAKLKSIMKPRKI
jgi:hypothetical protein